MSVSCSHGTTSYSYDHRRNNSHFTIQKNKQNRICKLLISFFREYVYRVCLHSVVARVAMGAFKRLNVNDQNQNQNQNVNV